MQIEKKQIAYNRVTRNSAICYIVIHDTGNKSKGADAQAHFNYFNGGNRNSSADFFVDDKTVLQVNDYTKYYTWHVGDGKGKYGITNQNSVGIEICVNADGNYDGAYAKAAELTKYLMKQLGIGAARVVRHYDASRKNCPASMSANNWALWEKLKQLIKEKIKMAECKFTDISGHYGEKQIREVFEMGIMNGVDETHFEPDKPVTRAQAAIIARNVVRYITGK